MADDWSGIRDKIGKEDLEFGTGTFSVVDEDGNSRNLTQIRAAHIPIEDDDGGFDATDVEVALQEAKGVAIDSDSLLHTKDDAATLATATNVNLLDRTGKTRVLGGILTISSDEAVASILLGINIDGQGENTYEVYEDSSTSTKRIFIPPIWSDTSINIRLKNTTGSTITYGFSLWHINVT